MTGKRGLIYLFPCLLWWGIGLWQDISWLGWCYLAFLLPPAVEDAKSGYISDAWGILLFLCGSSLAWANGFLTEALLSFVLTASLYGFFYVISKKSVGEGDIFLAAAAAVWLSPAGALLSLWLSAMAALLYVAVQAARGTYAEEIRFAPFIAVGGMITYALEKTLELSALLAGLPLG